MNVSSEQQQPSDLTQVRDLDNSVRASLAQESRSSFGNSVQVRLKRRAAYVPVLGDDGAVEHFRDPPLVRDVGLIVQPAVVRHLRPVDKVDQRVAREEVLHDVHVHVARACPQRALAGTVALGRMQPR